MGNHDKKQNICYIGLNILFYVLCAILIMILVYPHTSLAFRDKFYHPVFRGLIKEDIVMVKGKTEKLRVQGINKRVTYSSSNFRIVEAGMNGRLYARHTGTAFISVKVNKKIYKCRVRVIDINKKKITIKTGKKYSLKIKGISGRVHWSSSDTKIVKVNSKGTVYAVRKGTVTVTGKIKGNHLECRVTVSE